MDTWMDSGLNCSLCLPCSLPLSFFLSLSVPPFFCSLLVPPPSLLHSSSLQYPVLMSTVCKVLAYYRVSVWVSFFFFFKSLLTSQGNPVLMWCIPEYDKAWCICHLGPMPKRVRFCVKYLRETKKKSQMSFTKALLFKRITLLLDLHIFFHSKKDSLFCIGCTVYRTWPLMR